MTVFLTWALVLMAAGMMLYFELGPGTSTGSVESAISALNDVNNNNDEHGDQSEPNWRRRAKRAYFQHLRRVGHAPTSAFEDESVPAFATDSESNDEQDNGISVVDVAVSNAGLESSAAEPHCRRRAKRAYFQHLRRVGHAPTDAFEDESVVTDSNVIDGN